MHSKGFVIQLVANILLLWEPSTLSHPLLLLLASEKCFLVGVIKWRAQRGTKKKVFLEDGEKENRDQDFPGHAGTRGMDTRQNTYRKIVEIVAVRKWLVLSMVFMLPSDYFCIQSKHERQAMNIVWVAIFNTLLYKYFVTACVCIIGVVLFFS